MDVTVKTVLIVGDDPADIRELNELVFSASGASSHGPIFIVTADSRARVIQLLSRFEIDVLIAGYPDADRGYALIRWVQGGGFGLKTLLVVSEGDALPSASELSEDGVDAIVRRPIAEDTLREILADWFR